MSTSDWQRRWDGLERKYERQDWGGLDMSKDAGYIGRTMDDGAAMKVETGKA